MLRASRRALAALGLVGILCRAFVPVGLMPAPAAAGGPFVFCHGGAAGAFFRALAAHTATASHERHGAHDTDAADSAPDGAADEHLAWENCSFAAAFAQAALASTFDVALLALEHSPARLEPQSSAAKLSVRPYWARGPPPQTA